jgi:hypothetical protein
VTPEGTQYLNLLERRLGLLRALTDSLSASRKDFIAMDLAAIERRNAEHEQLCARVRTVDAELSTLQAHLAQKAGVKLLGGVISWLGSADGDKKQDERIYAALEAISSAQNELKTVNNAHKAMLSGSSRMTQLLQNFYTSFVPTYSLPRHLATTFEERV